MKKMIPLIIGFSPLVAFSLLTKILPSSDIGVAGPGGRVAGLGRNADQPARFGRPRSSTSVRS